MKRVLTIILASALILLLGACDSTSSSTTERVDRILSEYDQVKARTTLLYRTMQNYMTTPNPNPDPVTLEGYSSTVHTDANAFLSYLKLFYESSMPVEDFNRLVTQYLFLDDSANGYEWFVHFQPEEGNPRFFILYFKDGEVIESKTFGASR